jgi:hypothetical protein
LKTSREPPRFGDSGWCDDDEDDQVRSYSSDPLEK